MPQANRSMPTFGVMDNTKIKSAVNSALFMLRIAITQCNYSGNSKIKRHTFKPPPT